MTVRIIKPREYKFAGMENDPHGRMWTAQARKLGVFRVVDFDECVWHTEDWRVGRILGESKHHVSRTTSEGAGRFGSGRAWYDVRVLPGDVQDYLREVDRQIAELEKNRREFLKEHFHEWQPAKPEDCAQVLSGKGKTEAEADCRKANGEKISASTLKGEQGIAESFNRVFSGGK